MATYNEGEDVSYGYGVSKTSKDTLEEYWDKLLEKADHNEKEEIKFFVHCTALKGKKKIMECGRLIGGVTNLPARAPLASYDGMRGVWLAPSIKELPTRSPYGTQRLVFKVSDITRYLGSPAHVETTSDDEDKWDAPEQNDKGSKLSGKGNKKGKDKKERNKKSREVNRKQKECFLKGKIPEKVKYDLPLLFFECAHYYGSNQYVRLILIRETDANAEWCREKCKELDLRNNPFLEFHFGRIWTYRTGLEGKGYDVITEVLVAGDIVFDQLPEQPEWDVVGTMSRAGFDPRLGIC